MNYVDAIEKGEPPANPTRILQASIAADNRPPPPATAQVAAAAPRPTTPSIAAAGHAAGPAVPPPPSIKLPDPPKPHPQQQPH
jgi:peptidylprolyl isomerase